MTNKQDELLPCPFCGGTPKIVKRDVEPQGDPWYGKKIETFVLCDCGACLFDEGFHEGFTDDNLAASFWNTRPTPSDEVKRLEEAGEAEHFVTVIGCCEKLWVEHTNSETPRPYWMIKMKDIPDEYGDHDLKRLVRRIYLDLFTSDEAALSHKEEAE